jgi:O-antigen/teichoic acid export membrane protein
MRIFHEVERPPATDPSVATMVTTLAGGASLSLAGKFAGRLLGFIGDIAAARILGPVTFGLYAIGWTILRILNFITPIGLDKGVIYFAAPHWKKNNPLVRAVIDRSTSLTLLSGSVFGGIFFLGAPFLASSIFHKPELTYIFRWFSLSFPLSSSLAVIISATKITLNMKYSVWIQDVGQPVAGLLFLFLFYLMGHRLLGVLASDLASFTVALTLAVIVLRRLFPGIGSTPSAVIPTSKTLLAFSIPAALAGVFTPFLIWIDRLFVGFFRSSWETGIYQAVSQTSVIFAVILVAFNAIVTPMITPIHQSGNIKLLEELYRTSTKWGFYFSLPVFLWLCVFSRGILSAVFGASYDWGWPALVVLACGQLVNVGTGAVGPLLTMTGHQKRWSILCGGALLVNILLNWSLVPRWGIIGAACGTAFSLSSLFLVGVLQIRKVVGIWPYDGRFAKGIAAGILSGTAFWIARVIFPTEDIVRLGIVLFTGVALYILILLGLGLDREDNALIQTVFSRILPFRKKEMPAVHEPKD